MLGSEAIGARDAYRGSPTQSTLDHATELQTWTNVAFVAGGVFAAAGIALVVWPSPKPAAPEQAALGPPAGRSAGSIVEVVPAPDGVLLRGAF